MSGPDPAPSKPTLVSGLRQPLMWSVGRPTTADTRQRKIQHRHEAHDAAHSTLEPTAENVRHRRPRACAHHATSGCPDPLAEVSVTPTRQLKAAPRSAHAGVYAACIS